MQIYSALAISSQSPSSFSSFQRSSRYKNRLISSLTPELPAVLKPASTPKKTKSQMLTKELIRLEQDLEINLLSLNSKFSELAFTEKRKKKELKLHERCLEGIIHCIQFFDLEVFRVLSRNWTEYQKVLKKPEVRFSPNSTNRFTNTSEVAVQAGEELTEELIEEDFKQHKNLLSRAIFRLGEMNHERIIKTLKKLLLTLTPIEVPSYENSPNYSPNITKTTNFIGEIPVSTLSAGTALSKNKLGYIQITRAVQTMNYEGPTVETLSSLLIEKDRQIYQLMEQVSEFRKCEKKLLRTEEDLMVTKQVLKELQGKECQKCFEKSEKMKEDRIKIEELRKILEKNEKFESELKVAKMKLKESVSVIGKSNEKIIKLSGELEDLTEEIEEIRAERTRLAIRLAEEEAIRHSLENKLSEFQKSSQLNSSKYNISAIAEEPLEEDSTIKNFTRKKSLEESHFVELDFNSSIEQEFTSKTPTFDKKTAKIFKNFSFKKRKMAKLRSAKHKTLFHVFRITKEEFLSLPKKDRMELFDCLYEHKEKCGPECEHLKRAMTIRSRDKAQAFPVKKYNIVKN